MSAISILCSTYLIASILSPLETIEITSQFLSLLLTVNPGDEMSTHFAKCLIFVTHFLILSIVQSSIKLFYRGKTIQEEDEGNYQSTGETSEICRDMSESVASAIEEMPHAVITSEDQNEEEDFYEYEDEVCCQDTIEEILDNIAVAVSNVSKSTNSSDIDYTDQGVLWDREPNQQMSPSLVAQILAMGDIEITSEESSCSTETITPARLKAKMTPAALYAHQITTGRSGNADVSTINRPEKGNHDDHNTIENDTGSQTIQQSNVPTTKNFSGDGKTIHAIKLASSDNSKHNMSINSHSRSTHTPELSNYDPSVSSSSANQERGSSAFVSMHSNISNANKRVKKKTSFFSFPLRLKKSPKVNLEMPHGLEEHILSKSKRSFSLKLRKGFKKTTKKLSRIFS